MSEQGNTEPTYAKDEKGRFVSGNIGGGRPKGSRNNLQERFIDDIYAAWQAKGADAIDAMIADKPGDFVKVVAGLMPKEATLNINDHSELTDAELAERVRSLAAQLAPFLIDGIGAVEGGTGGEGRAQITSGVH